MRFEFIPSPRLPRLAWWARLSRGGSAVELRHGPWVETRGDWFAEAAWDGPFSRSGFESATHLTGTGGRTDGDAIRFCSPTTMLDRIASIRVGDVLCVSNSIPCLLAITHDAPDPSHPHYFWDLVEALREGIRRPNRELPTLEGRAITLHDYGDMIVSPDLSWRRAEKPRPPEPRSFETFAQQLTGVVARVTANANDPARSAKRLRPVATLSLGYDANAIAVCLRALGANEAITFAQAPGEPNDDGGEIGKRLGFDVTRYDRWGFRRLDGAPEAEFAACPPGADVVMAVCERQLEGTLLATGRHGDVLLSTDPGVTLPDLLEPGARYLGGSTLTEFRLRVGFQQFAPFYGFAIHAPAIGEISRSEAMRPWSVLGGYDRPIARRLVEQAGVPREWFGMKKIAGANAWPLGFEQMSPGGAADFRAFLDEFEGASAPAEARFQASRLATRVRDHVVSVLPPLRRRFRAASLDRFRQPLRPQSFAFHWGCDRLRARYAPDA